MKILISITKGEIGGAQVFVANLAKGLKNTKNNNIIPVIACGEGDFLPNFARKENIEIYNLKSLKRSSNPLSHLLFLFDFYKLIKKNKFDVIHLNSSNTLLGAISAKLVSKKNKVVFTIHGLSVLDPNYKAGFLKKVFFKYFFKFCFLFVDEIIFVSQSNLDLFLINNKKLAKKCSLIYNSISVDYFSRVEAREFIFSKIGILDEGRFLVGSIGRLAYPKNYEFLINIFPEILKIRPSAKLVLIGDGPEREKYDRLIKDRGLIGYVFLLGEIMDGSRYLKALDLFVLPSIYEGLSISLIEVLGSGISVMASDVGGNAEVIGKENCYILDNEIDFINIFKKIISTEEKSYVDDGRFLVEGMVDKYIGVYVK